MLNNMVEEILSTFLRNEMMACAAGGGHQCYVKSVLYDVAN